MRLSTLVLLLTTCHAGYVTVNTTLGPIIGSYESAGEGGAQDIMTFRGVPFAASTGGANRWLPPQPRTPWTLPLNTTVNGPGCRQPHHNADVPCRGQEGPRCESEDCLNLNLYCPAAAPPAGSAGYPVIVWIYGGAFNEGMNWGPLNLYDGSELAARGQVCVAATNYRLGVLGFLVTKDSPGNQAIKDQRMAMEWVRDNIGAFGGDATQVTLMGQSAGAMSVVYHVVSPRSQGLFHRAIVQSDPAAFQYQTKLAQKATFGAKFAKLANCSKLSNLACLRALDAKAAVSFGEKASSAAGEDVISRILAGGKIEDAFAMQWAPVVDGDDLPGQPLELFATGKFTPVPMLVGTVQDEGATFIYDGVNSRIPELLFPTVMKGIFGTSGANVTSFYKPAAAAADWRDVRDSLSYVLTDYWFKCASERIAKAAAAALQPVFVYRFDHVLSFPEIFPQQGLPAICENRTCHASEVPFIFHQFANYTPNAAEMQMSSTMMAWWTGFVRTGDVNANPAVAAPHWPLFNGTERLNMRLGIDMGVESTKTGQAGALPTNGVCDLFDDVIGYQH